MTALFQHGSFSLASGRTSTWKIECDALRHEDWATLAAMAVELYGRPRWADGVPRGGMPFADALRHYQTPGGGLWIVDDVLTTGESLERHRSGRDAFGLVVFARGPLPDWVNALFVVPALQ